jgi:hypothetical protein
MVRRFVHFGVLSIAKYRYSENSAANPIFLKIPLILKKSRYWYKNARNIFQKESLTLLFRGKIPSVGNPGVNKWFWPVPRNFPCTRTV